VLDEQRINDQTRDLLATLHITLDRAPKFRGWTVAMQQMIEIAKAISFQSEVLIMDEPTAALTQAEIDDLFAIINQLRANGVGIVYISHRLRTHANF